MCGSVGLFGLLPFIVRKLGGEYTLGVYIGTGIAVIWYTVETYYLRLEMARQNQIASDQSETAIRPLLVSRTESVTYKGHPLPTSRTDFVLRNIGHGPALFVEVQDFTLRTQHKGSVLVHIDPLDLVEANTMAVPVLKPESPPVGGQRPDPDELVRSLSPATAPDDCEIMLSYENIRGQRFESVVRMGRSGTKLLRHGPK